MFSAVWWHRWVECALVGTLIHSAAAGATSCAGCVGMRLDAKTRPTAANIHRVQRPMVEGVSAVSGLTRMLEVR